MRVLLAVLVLIFGATALMGAPYLPTRRRQIEAALRLLALKPGQTVIDLGSGDGAFLLAAAKQGAKAVGYEINPILWLASKLRTLKYRRQVTIHLASYWNHKLPKADGIYVFLISRYMGKLAAKLQTELKQPTKVASYTFDIPGKKSRKSLHGIHLYQYP